MAKKKTKKKVKKNSNSMESCCNTSSWKGSSCGGGFYGLGFLGALIYYISTATGFWNGVLGLLKAIVWPVFVVMKILGL